MRGFDVAQVPNASILEITQYGDVSANDEKVWRATGMAYLGDSVSQLPDDG